MLTEALRDTAQVFADIGRPVAEGLGADDLSGREWAFLLAFAGWFFGTIGLGFLLHPIFGLAMIVIWCAILCTALADPPTPDAREDADG